MASLGRLAAQARVVCRSFGVTKLELFGSYARRSATPASDVDLIATFEGSPGLGLIAFQRALESRLGKRVDLFEAHAVATMRNPFRKASIEADRTTLYEA